MAKKAKAKVKDDKKTASFEVGTKITKAKLLKIWDADHPIKPYFASEVLWSKALPSRSSFIVERVRVNKAETWKSFAIANDDIRISWGEGFVNDEFRRMNPTMVRFKDVPQPIGRVEKKKTAPKTSKKKKKSKRTTKKKSKGQ